MTDTTTLTLEELRKLCVGVLEANGFSKDHARTIAEVVWAGQRDECHSHGAYRLISCVETMRVGKISPDAVPEVYGHAPGIVRVDAKGAYSLLSFERGRPLLVEKARRQGIAALAINHCYHFSALWPEVEALAADGVAAIAMVPGMSMVAPAGGTKPVFGTNPFAFAWPRPNGNPYVFDFATSVVARGEVELHKRAGKPIPLGWGIDKAGQPTTDPAAAIDGALLTFGTYKGTAIATMIELLAGPLIGDFLSLEAKAYDAGSNVTPYRGELIIAFDPVTFLGADADRHRQRAEHLFEAITGQGARLPSERRYAARARNLKSGTVTIPRKLHEDILALYT
jgi:LDH2 family malate/lactate/ureidoglycolate dehydrogenase